MRVEHAIGRLTSIMNIDDRFIELAALIASSHRAKFGSGAPMEIIADAERHLGTPFPPSYRWWLASYGAGYLGGYEIQGLCPVLIVDRELDLPLIGDIIDCARRNTDAKLYPSHLLELLSYDGDEVYLFDTRRQSADGEWPIVCIRAGSSETEDVSGSFAQFLSEHL